MLHYEAITSEALELLKRLSGISGFERLRLVGGTSLASQIGHRKSIDLGSFGQLNMEMIDLNAALKKVASVQQIKNSPKIHIYLLNGIKVDIMNYSYPWIGE